MFKAIPHEISFYLKLLAMAVPPSDCAGEVFAQEIGDCGCELTLRRLDVFANSQRRRVWADHSEPDKLRRRDVFAVVGPVDAVIAAAMVGRDDQGRFVLILRDLLQGLPQVGQVAIRVEGCIEVEIVTPAVTPFVGFTQADEQDARLVPQ